MFALISAVGFAVSAALTPPDSAQLRREALMRQLHEGGYTVLLRHARTDYTFKEDVAAIPKERNQQRNLTEDGIRDAALMGVVFRKYGISFTEILASPMYRTVETAQMAAGEPKTSVALRAFPPTPEQATLVKTAPKPGTNRLLVTHHFVIEQHVPGVKPGDVGESEAAVVRHLPDGSVQLVGLIKLEDWKALSNPGYGQTPQPSTSNTTFVHGGLPLPKQGGAPDKIPDTHAAHLAHGYITAFNSGDPNTMRTFIEASMVSDPSRPTAARLETYAKLFEEHGPLSLVSVDTVEALKVTLGMRSKRGLVYLTLKSTEADPMHAASVTFTYAQERD